MVKGVNKQMIVLKPEGNRLYEQVCFVLRNDVKQSRESERDMLNEANRILAEMDIKRVKPRRLIWLSRVLWWLLLLAVGVCVGYGLSFLR